MNFHKIKGKDNPFAAVWAILTFVFLESLVAAQALLAYRDHFLTVSQMQQSGISHGLPFMWHFGMWTDILIISSSAGYVVGRYFSSWRRGRMLLSLAIGFISAAILSWVYTLNGTPEAHVVNHHLTATGVVHFFYMGFAIAVFAQFYFFTENMSARLLKFISLLLLLHAFVGTHMVLGSINVISPMHWYNAKPLKSVLGWITIAILALGLAWRNLGTSGIIDILKKTARSLYWFYVYVTDEDPESSEGYLKFLKYWCAFFAIGGLIFTCLKTEWQAGSSLVSIILIAIIGTKYLLSMLSAKQELRLVPSVFPQGLVPDELKPRAS